MKLRQSLRPLQVRVIAVLLVVVAVVVVFLGVSQVVTARDAERARALASERAEAHLAASALATALTGQLQVVTNLAGQAQVATLFGASSSELAGIAPTLHTLYPAFTSFAFVSAGGELMARWPTTPSVIGENVSARPVVAGVLRHGRPFISSATQQRARPYKVVVAFGAPVTTTGGQVIGILVGSEAIHTLGAFIGGTRLNDQGQLVIVDQDAHLLSGPATGADHTYRHLPVIASALGGRPGSVQAMLPGYHGDRLISYAAVPHLGWAVLVEEPMSTLNGPLGALTLRLVGILVAVLALLIGAALVVFLLLRQLGETHGRSTAILASVGDGVATVSSNGILRTANPALERLTGRRAAELEGRPWSEVVVVSDQRGRRLGQEDSLVRRAIRRREPVASEGFDRYLEQPDGSRLPVALTAAPLMVRDEARGAVVVVRNVAREHEIDQLKSSLVSTVSHELRTPLTMIQGFSELLLDRQDLGPDRTHEALEQIHTSAERLGRLIDDLLSVARIDAGKVAVELAPLRVERVMADVVGLFGSRHPDRRFTVDIEPGLPALLADRDKLVQVLTNLISNAVKYSPAGAPVELLARQGGGVAVVSVVDHGNGLDERERAEIFEKFARLDRPDVRHAGGTGLGLYITRGLVQLLGGELWVDSTPDSGSAFSFTVPYAPGPTSSPVDQPPDPPAAVRHDALSAHNA